MTSSPSSGHGHGHVTFKFSKIIDNMSEMVQDIVKWKTYRKSCMAYRMAWLRISLSEAEGHFCCFKPLQYS